MDLDETISAIATPIGEGGLAVIRISGKQAFHVADSIFFPKSKKHGNFRCNDLAAQTVCLGEIRDQDEIVDEVMLTLFRAPRSYTCEDTVEISCHGGYVTARRILTLMIQNGARLAEPGEFTKRAFLNGRLDLTQAEAVAELIHATSELATKAALRQLRGSLKHRIESLRSQLINCLAQIEAAIDFPEEDLSLETIIQIESRLKAITVSLQSLLSTRTDSKSIREGFRTVIAGGPNVGKSSLLNALLASDRAIVSPTPGTTRDTIEELITVQGIPFRLIDTAGLRECVEEIETAGIVRSQKALSEADIILFVLDGSRPITKEETDLLAIHKGSRTILVINKIDLPATTSIANHSCSRFVMVSAKTGAGLEDLKSSLVQLATKGKDIKSGSEFLVNVRHEAAIRRALSCIDETKASLASHKSPEFIAADLRLAADALGEIVGITTTDDILDVLFSTFCIGK